MALTTTVATGTTDPLTGITTFDPPPAGVLGIVRLDANGKFLPVPQAALGTGGTPGAPVTIAEMISLSALQAKPGSGQVAANVQYACSSDLWNNAAGGTVWVLGLKPDAYWPVGVGTVNGKRQLVTIDVAAATYVPFAAGVAGTPRDPFAVGDVASITAAVTDASNTWVDGDLTGYGTPALQDAGAPAAVAGQNSTILVGTADVVTLDEFSMLDSTGSAWCYRYARRNDGTSGWTRTPKG